MFSLIASKSLAASRSPFLFSSPSPYSPSLPLLLLEFPLQRRRSSRCLLRLVRAQDSGAIASGGSSEQQKPKDRRDILVEYVTNIQPEFIQLCMERAPEQVVNRMVDTVKILMSTLPATLIMAAKDLKPRMYVLMKLGYFYRHAQYYLELQQSSEWITKNEVPDVASGTQKKVSGEAIGQYKITGSEETDAVKYIEYLEEKIEELELQVARISNGNQLLRYISTLQLQDIKRSGDIGGADVSFAMERYVKLRLAYLDLRQKEVRRTKESVPSLTSLFIQLMIVGYSLREFEVRHDMTRMLAAPK